MSSLYLLSGDFLTLDFDITVWFFVYGTRNAFDLLCNICSYLSVHNGHVTLLNSLAEENIVIIIMDLNYVRSVDICLKRILCQDI